MSAINFDHLPIVGLLERYKKLDGMLKGYAYGHMNDAIKSFAVAMDVVEKIDADNKAKEKAITDRKSVGKSKLRLVA